MSFVFQNETQHSKLNLVDVNSHSVLFLKKDLYLNVCGTWMCCGRGEGEKEVKYQGRSRVKVVSSQGTICKGQLKGPKVLRMRARRSTQKMYKSAGCTTDSNSTPLFLLINKI